MRGVTDIGRKSESPVGLGTLGTGVTKAVLLDSSHYIEYFACVAFTEFLFLPYSFNRTGLGLIVFGLGLTRHVWSRSRSHSLWSWSQSRSHCVVVSLTSLVSTAANPTMTLSYQ